MAARKAILARFLDNVSSGDTTGAHQITELDGPMGLHFVVEQIDATVGQAVDFSDAWLPTDLLNDLEVACADQPAILSDARVSAFRTAAFGNSAEQAAREKEREKLNSVDHDLADRRIVFAIRPLGWLSITLIHLGLLSAGQAGNRGTSLAELH